jgi:hypothetical protein
MPRIATRIYKRMYVHIEAVLSRVENKTEEAEQRVSIMIVQEAK